MIHFSPRMRRLQLHRRTLSSQSHTESSADPSLTSGSMDSYASHPSSTDPSSDDAHKWKDLADSATLSPSEMDSDGATERQHSDPFNKLRPIDTEPKEDVHSEDGEGNGEGIGDTLFESPTSDAEAVTPVK